MKPLENAGLFRLVEIIPQGHTFATTALEHGMDIKTLSAIVGHISSATTIDIYSHITDTMQVRAANRVEQGLGRGEAVVPREDAEGEVPAKPEIPPERARFEPYRGKNRKSGTGEETGCRAGQPYVPKDAGCGGSSGYSKGEQFQLGENTYALEKVVKPWLH